MIRSALVVLCALFMSATAGAAPLLGPAVMGFFDFPSPGCGGVTACQGVGTSQFGTGEGDPTVLAFNGFGFKSWELGPDGSARVDIGELFIANGRTTIGTSVSAISLVFAVVQPPALPGERQALYVLTPESIRINIVVTPNVWGDPYLDRDFYTFTPTLPEAGGASIDEDGKASFMVQAVVSRLQGPFRVAEPDIDVYGITVTGLSAPSNSSGGIIPAPSTVPEPSMVSLVALAGLTGLVRRRR